MSMFSDMSSPNALVRRSSSMTFSMASQVCLRHRGDRREVERDPGELRVGGRDHGGERAVGTADVAEAAVRAEIECGAQRGEGAELDPLHTVEKRAQSV